MNAYFQSVSRYIYWYHQTAHSSLQSVSIPDYLPTRVLGGHFSIPRAPTPTSTLTVVTACCLLPPRQHSFITLVCSVDSPFWSAKPTNLGCNETGHARHGAQRLKRILATSLFPPRSLSSSVYSTQTHQFEANKVKLQLQHPAPPAWGYYPGSSTSSPFSTSHTLCTRSNTLH